MVMHLRSKSIVLSSLVVGISTEVCGFMLADISTCTKSACQRLTEVYLVLIIASTGWYKFLWFLRCLPAVSSMQRFHLRGTYICFSQEQKVKLLSEPCKWSNVVREIKCNTARLFAVFWATRLDELQILCHTDRNFKGYSFGGIYPLNLVLVDELQSKCFCHCARRALLLPASP